MKQEASSPTRQWRVRRTFFAGSRAKHSLVSVKRDGAPFEATFTE
jgi:hypothetical protein